MRGLARREALALISGMTVAALAAGCGGGGDQFPDATQADRDALNFLLNLAYLQAEAYSIATTGNSSLTHDDTTGISPGGVTVGGKQISFADATLAKLAAQLTADAVAEVRALRVLITAPLSVAKPAIDLNALGYGFANDAEFLKLARYLEDLAASLYLGLLLSMTSYGYIHGAQAELALSAAHSGAVRLLVVSKGISSPAIDAIDVPPTADALFAEDAKHAPISRTKDQALPLLRGTTGAKGLFFPQGLNGTIS